MPLQFILGGPGAGKTTFVLEEIRARIADSSVAAPLYYLVPEQFSLQSEKLLLSHGREAATQVQVLSFNRLAYRLFSALGKPAGQIMGDLGKQMLIRKVLFEAADKLIYYKSSSDKHGFVEELCGTITELNHYRVSAEELTDRAVGSSPALAAKLSDIALILTTYRETVKDKYLLTDDMPELLCQKLEAFSHEPLKLLDGADFWVDGFSGFTPQERQVLLYILKRANRLTVTLTLPTQAAASAPYETMEQLTQMARDSRIPVEPHIYMKENYRHINAPGLAYFVENFGDSGAIAYLAGHDGRNDASIEIISAADRYAAVYATAGRILQLVRENGHRFRDIAILCGDRTHYEKILQTVFDRLGIPLFVDTETDILSHPLTEMIRAALEIPMRNWSYESVFRFLKTRLTGLDPVAVDILENYALANGINSYRWQYSFSDPVAEEGRLQLLNALATYAKLRADSMATVRVHARRVFDMLYALKVPETLQGWFDARMAAGDPATARLHGQIWPKLCEVFDKLVEILGDEKVSHKVFAQTLDAGLFQVGLGRIPPTIDQVILGDIGRSRYPEIQTMLVLGANEGILPPVPTQSGLFTDFERKILRNTALELAPENQRKLTDHYYNLYCALSQPKEKLIFIYAEAEPGGKALRPSPILGKIRKMFPTLETTSAPSFSEYGDAEAPAPAQNQLSPASVNLLYGQTILTAATRLEAFARCPFAYYMSYILGARPRARYQVLPTDLGKLFHDILTEFTRIAPLEAMARPQINALVDDLVQGLILDTSIYHDTARNRHILNKVRRVASASCWAICEQIKRGEYQPTLTEFEILSSTALPDGRSLSLTGRVDRVDIHTVADHEYVKIIDYKSGQAKFSPEEVRHGIQLQLMLYMNAMLQSRSKARKNAKPGGVFYFPIDDPIIQADDILSDAAREEGLLKCFKMSGLAVEAPADLENFLNLSRDAENKVKELGLRMTQGDITAKPFKGPKSPCQYCNYSAVCGHLSI
ncbi:MAG: PD-(D/E)XK nuclease family protein [Defluviitaleaceae bacterium]|nr:PD-(D/E)XK nuclease family protein [Defluviitaleaceae bacterium]